MAELNAPTSYSEHATGPKKPWRGGTVDSEFLELTTKKSIHHVFINGTLVHTLIWENDQRGPAGKVEGVEERHGYFENLEGALRWNCRTGWECPIPMLEHLIP